jgi:DNA-binding NtrC family response regulator
MKNGAFDYLIKPFSAEQLGVTLKKAEEFTQLVRVNRYLSQDNEDSSCELLGQSPAMENLRQLIRKVAHTQATVLIQGESGTRAKNWSPARSIAPARAPARRSSR